MYTQLAFHIYYVQCSLVNIIFFGYNPTFSWLYIFRNVLQTKIIIYGLRLLHFLKSKLSVTLIMVDLGYHWWINQQSLLNLYAPFGHETACSKKDFGRRGVFITSRINLSGRFWLCFSFLAISPLIMVRFQKFKNRITSLDLLYQFMSPGYFWHSRSVRVICFEKSKYFSIWLTDKLHRVVW